MKKPHLILRQDKTLHRFVLASVAFAIGLDLISLKLGLAFATDGSSRGYLQSINWWPYPLFFLLVGLLIHMTWVPYVSAWRSFAGKIEGRHVLRRNGLAVANAEAIEPTVEWLHRRRKACMYIAAVVAVLLSAVVDWCLWSDYGLVDGPMCEGERGNGWGQAFLDRAPDRFPPITKASNAAFLCAAYTMQSALIAMALVALMQAYLHVVAFHYFERLDHNRKQGLSLALNHNDRLEKEFGLHKWNFAVNWGYVVIFVAMVIPVFHFLGQPKGTLELSQVLLRFSIPLIVLGPAILPVVTRFTRAEAAGDDLVSRGVKAEDPEWKSYKEQKIWPFDGHRFGWVFFLASVAALLYLWGVTLIELIKKFVPG